MPSCQMCQSALITFFIASARWSAGCEPSTKPRKLAASASLDVFAVSATEMPDSRATIDPKTGATIYLIVPAVVETADVQSVEKSPDQTALVIRLTPDSAKKLAAATTPATGQQLAVVVNGRVMSVSRVMSPLADAFAISCSDIQKNREEIFEALTTE